MAKEIIKIKLNGDDYLNYLKYKDSQKIDWNPENKKRLFILLCLALISIFLTIIIKLVLDRVYPIVNTPFVFNSDWFAGFILVCIGLAWVLHGFGFIIVRR
jgi:hypothetical protein